MYNVQTGEEMSGMEKRRTEICLGWRKMQEGKCTEWEKKDGRGNVQGEQM